jgi:cyclopropane fatty-acyl-phospholipid synthase-like methyltransferase
MNSRERSIKEYYETTESRFCYRYLLNGSQHFGFYPDGDITIGESRAQRLHHDLLAALLDLPPGSVVLDAGCGQGVVSADMASRYGLRVVGIDIVPYLLKKAPPCIVWNGFVETISEICWLIPDWQMLQKQISVPTRCRHCAG